MAKSYKLVYIEWVDAESNHAWVDNNELAQEKDKIGFVKEVGWVIESDKKFITLCSQLNGDLFGNRTTIPKHLIKKIVNVQRSKKI